jgi:multisubunit Na+/H+ antiporter MnhB subunit
MNSAFDSTGLLIVAAAIGLLALVFRAVSRGRMKPALKRALFVIVLLIAGLMLWNISISFQTAH